MFFFISNNINNFLFGSLVSYFVYIIPSFSKGGDNIHPRVGGYAPPSARFPLSFKRVRGIGFSAPLVRRSPFGCFADLERTPAFPLFSLWLLRSPIEHLWSSKGLPPEGVASSQREENQRRGCFAQEHKLFFLLFFYLFS